MSFNRILRSSALMGGAQLVVLAGGFIRAKVVAMIFGAAGVGLIGIFTAFSGNISSLAGWGLGTTGVRLIASSDESEKLSKVKSVRRMGMLLSVIGLILALLTFFPVGIITFDSTKYAMEMAIVALAVPCLIASSAWSAILHASGRVASLAKVHIAGALTALLLGLPAIYFWGTIGIAISILLAAAVPAIVLWRAIRTSEYPAVITKVNEADMRHLVKLGGALMVVGWLGQLSAYAVRIVIVRQEGLEAAGYYQAAYAISGSLPGFIFAAMGADFFPRIASEKDESGALEITERQILAGLLLGVPLIIALITLGRLGIRLLYDRTFDPAIPLLSWMTWGVFARLVAWPLGYWMLARRSSLQLIVVEGIACLLSLVLPVLLMSRLGLIGAGVGFFCAAVVYAIMLAFLLCRRPALSFVSRTTKTILIAALAIGACQWASSLIDNIYFGVLPTTLAAFGCLWLYRKFIKQEEHASAI